MQRGRAQKVHQKGGLTDIPKNSSDAVGDIALLDQLILDAYKLGPPEETILRDSALLKQLTKTLVERCLDTEMEDHLGYEKNDLPAGTMTTAATER